MRIGQAEQYEVHIYKDMGDGVFKPVAEEEIPDPATGPLCFVLKSDFMPAAPPLIVKDGELQHYYIDAVSGEPVWEKVELRVKAERKLMELADQMFREYFKDKDEETEEAKEQDS